VINKRINYLAIVLLINGNHALATEHNIDDPFLLTEAPVVLSATRLKQSLSEAPAAMTVIDKKMIKASGAKEIVELFRLVPGMQIGYKRGHLPSASYHGMSDDFAKGMQVLVDGHSIYSPSFGGLFWVDYPLLIEDIERIEVIRGPSASSYGPNSFLGVINIVTSHTSQDQGSKANFRLGGGDYYRGSVQHTGQWKDLGYRFSYAHNENEGLESVLDDQEIDMLSSRFDYQLSSKDTLQYNFGYSEGKHQVGAENSIIEPDRFERSTQMSQTMKWMHQLDLEDQFSLQLTHNRHEMKDKFTSEGQAASNSQLAERLDFEFQHNFSLLDNTRMVWGGGSRLDRMRLPAWIGTDDDKTNVLYRVFANIEQRFLEDFSLNLGALLEKNSYTSVDISPKIALNYSWSDQQSFRIMASKASRMPAMVEQHLDIQKAFPTLIAVRGKANQTLKPVEVITFEVGHHGQFFNKTLLTDIKIAHQRFNRLPKLLSVYIDPNPTPGPVVDYGTGDVASSVNYEMQLDYKPNEKALVHFGYSWMNIQQKGGFLNYRESAPHNTLNVLTAYEFPQQWQASLAYYYHSEMQYLRTFNGMEQSQRLDFVLRKQIKLAERQTLELSFIHQNTLGSKDEVEGNNRLADRSFFEISYQYD